MKTQVQIMYWHDIPVQVRAKKGRSRFSVELPQRFQVAVDQAAMAAGLTGSDAYLEYFRWSDPVSHDGEPDEAARAVAAEVAARFEQIDWRRTAEALSHS